MSPATTTETTPKPIRTADMVADAKTRTENLTVDQVAAELRDGETLLVDVREPNEWAENGTIPGALLRPRGMLEFWADPSSPYHQAEFDPGRRIVLHCAAGSRSALAADALMRLGYQRVAHLEGGFKAWVAAGQPVERSGE